MFFDPNTNFAAKGTAQAPQQPAMQRFNPQQQPQQKLNPSLNLQQQQQSIPQPIQSFQQQQPASSSAGPEINPRIAQIRLEQSQEDNEDQGWLQQKINEIVSSQKETSTSAEKELEYLEKLMKNPFIKQKYLFNIDAENMRMFVLFNSRQNLDYKLKHYLYYSSQAKGEFDLQFYNKLYLSRHQVNLSRYLQYNSKEPDYVLVNRSSLRRIYGSLQQNVIESDMPNVIVTQPYRGFYSRQYDYQFFNLQQQAEKTASGE